MAEFPALPLWTDAYLGDTTHLTTIEHGAYLLLLMTAWRTRDCCLPDDDRLLARYTRLNPKQWAKMRPILEPFFVSENGQWRQRRLTDEANAVRRRKDAAAANGRASALKRQGRHSTERQPTINEATDEAPTNIQLNQYHNQTTDKESVVPAKHGNRLPADFQVPHEWLSWAVATLGWSLAEAEAEAANFVDFWHAKTGRDATKLDWNATWRVWCRNARRNMKRSDDGYDRDRITV